MSSSPSPPPADDSSSSPPQCVTPTSSPLPPQTLLQKLCSDSIVPRKGGVKLTDVNPHLVCVLCHGYFVDATSIVECLHSFCRSCIVLHLDKNSFCPICREDIQNSKALKPDKALQDIVYKLVPGLFHSEMKRRQEFYRKHPHRDMHLHPESRGVSVDRIVYTVGELISISLEYYDKECEQEMWKNVTDDKGLHYKVRTDKPQRCIVRKRYLKCPAAVRMSHLKKFIRLKYNLKPTDFVELMYRRESLPEEYSIMDIAYIYTWNRNEPMRFFYKINARVIVPIMPVTEKCLATLNDVTSEPGSLTHSTVETVPLPSQVKSMITSSPIVKTASSLGSINETTKEEDNKAVPELLKVSVAEEPETVEVEKRSIMDSVFSDPAVKLMKTDVTKKDRRLTPPPTNVVVSSMSLNPPISPEGTSRKENVSDNVRNSCANESAKSTPAVIAMDEKFPNSAEQKTGTTNDVPMKKLEKLVDQQAPSVTVATTVASATVPPPTTKHFPKKPSSVGESKLNLSISKLIMKNQNASATTKFVPTLQQMQQIGMHTSIPTFQQQQQQHQPPPSSPQPNAYVRPGYPGMHPFKRTPDVAPVHSQASTNRPPFIPVRKSYEWNKARNSAAKQQPPSPVASTAANSRDSKTKEKSPAAERLQKKMTADKPPPTSIAAVNYLPTVNADEMNAAHSLLKVGQDFRLPKPPTMVDLHDKYNCESSLQITKVTEPETNQSPVAHEKHSPTSQPSLQIMRVPPTAEKSPKPATAVAASETSGGNTVSCGVNTGVVSNNKPVNKKPVPSLYSMPTNKRMKDDHQNQQQHHNVSGGSTDNKRIERRVDTENGVLSVSLLTETSKQDMDAKRREVVQPDVSIKLMTFPTESAKKTPELNPISGGTANNNKRKHDEVNPTCGGGNNGTTNGKRKPDEPNQIGGSGTINNNKRKQDENPNSVGGGVAGNKRTKQDELSNPVGGGGGSGNVVNKRKQDEPERRATPPRPAPTKDDIPQLIEINSSPYAKLLPAKKQHAVPKHHPTPKQQPSAKQQPSSKQQSSSKQQTSSSKQQPKVISGASARVLDLSKSPPNGCCVKRTPAPHSENGLQSCCSSTACSSNNHNNNNNNNNSNSIHTMGPVQLAPPPAMDAATSAAINSNLLFAAQRQAAAYLLKQHFDSFNNGLMRNGGKGGPAEWPRAMFNPALFARPPTNMNN